MTKRGAKSRSKVPDKHVVLCLPSGKPVAIYGWRRNGSIALKAIERVEVGDRAAYF